MPALEQGQAAPRIRPGVQPVPDAVQVVDFVLGEPFDGEAREQLVQDHAVQLVDVHPGQLARTHARHRRPVAGAPGVGEGVPVDGELFPAAERAAFADDRTAPVHDRAENVEYQGADRAGAGRHGLDSNARHPCSYCNWMVPDTVIRMRVLPGSTAGCARDSDDRARAAIANMGRGGAPPGEICRSRTR